MKIETLKDRINKGEEKIKKFNSTVERHKKQLDKKSKALINKGIDLNNYDKFDKNIINNDTYWELCDYEKKLEELENTNKKISETTEKLNKYKEQLKNQIAKDKETEGLIPECLNIFLKQWKQKCMDFYVSLSNKYIEMKFKEYEVTKEELENLEKEDYNYNKGMLKTVKRYTDEQIEQILEEGSYYLYYRDIKSCIYNRHFENFKKSLFASDLFIVEKIVDHDTINNKILNKILDDDVQIKKEIFIKRIKQVIGEITDLSDLRIGGNGEINGVAKGVKANAKVETITAGGYNIQCYHFRVLVNTVK